MMKSKKRATSSRQISAILLGRDGVGKSEETYSHSLDIDGESVSLSILDTSGKKSEKRLEEYLGIGDLYIVMYSITDRISFMEARRLGSFLRERISGNVEMVLVGNKTDLHHSREILEREGNLLSEELECKFYEISTARHFADVEFMMNDAVKRHMMQRQTDKSNKTSLLKVKENLSRNKSFRSLKRRMSIS